MTVPDKLELLVTTRSSPMPIRVPLRRSLTTVGSIETADVQITSVPPHWLVARRNPDGVEVCELATGARFQLRVNESAAVGGAQLLLSAAESERRELPVAQIADALSTVTSATAALRLLLDRVMSVTDADNGAVIVSERGDYQVAVALNRSGEPLIGGERLLSDTIVRDALAGQSAVSESALGSNPRYRTVPSVVDLKLEAVLAIPMVLGERVLGAIYLGRHTSRARFDERYVRDISVVASMAIPFLAQLRRTERADHQRDTGGLIGESESMCRVRDLIARVAQSDLSVLVTGETGTGKEVTARAIHAQSRRVGRPMVALNCSAVSPALLEAELFGYRKGAFTGAVSDREGRIEAAHGSTLFLDEVGDMPLPMQAALLRVLQEREVVRVGENQPRNVDFRLVAATHRDLDKEAKEGRFRPDLLYRLRELPLELPPLRERGDDTLLLANLFLRQAELELGIVPPQLSAAAMETIRHYPWPGNVRELRSTMRRAAVLCRGELISEAELGLRPPVASRTLPHGPDLDLPLAAAKEAFVRSYVEAVIDRNDGNREAAAAALGISLRSLYRHVEPT